MTSGRFFIFPQADNTYKGIQLFDLDLASCVTDSPCGIPVLVYRTLPAYYLQLFYAAATACDGYTLRATYDTALDADFCTDTKAGSGNTTFTLRGQALAKTFKAGFYLRFSN
ncbi:uncharacterized protein LOC108669185 [Hyalella azteca]|uniref:Uncharacterized protein LOC108669185 n=1 Tax=Hyalella azteca TaxID=294128 RepID=A0A8B7NED4_HYAAZ|nr:uncharacterized protein LOC108669185 [Hyalella azteca]